jgi:hypothetical protein
LKKLWEAASHRSWIATGGTIGVFRSPTEEFREHLFLILLGVFWL